MARPGVQTSNSWATQSRFLLLTSRRVLQIAGQTVRLIGAQLLPELVDPRRARHVLHEGITPCATVVTAALWQLQEGGLHRPAQLLQVPFPLRQAGHQLVARGFQMETARPMGQEVLQLVLPLLRSQTNKFAYCLLYI